MAGRGGVHPGFGAGGAGVRPEPAAERTAAARGDGADADAANEAAMGKRTGRCGEGGCSLPSLAALMRPGQAQARSQPQRGPLGRGRFGEGTESNSGSRAEKWVGAGVPNLAARIPGARQVPSTQTCPGTGGCGGQDGSPCVTLAAGRSARTPSFIPLDPTSPANRIRAESIKARLAGGERGLQSREMRGRKITLRLPAASGRGSGSFPSRWSWWHTRDVERGTRNMRPPRPVRPCPLPPQRPGMFLTPWGSDALPKLDPATVTLGRDEEPRAAPMCPFYCQVSSPEETFPSVPTSLSSAGFGWPRDWGWGQHPVTLLGAAWMQQLPSERSIPNPFSKFSPITAALCQRPQAPPAHTFQLQKKK